jgi:hypothetical protein
LALYVDCYATGQVGEARPEKALDEVMDLTPRGIREHLGNRPIYARTSAYGHFGRAPKPMAASPGSAPTSSTNSSKWRNNQAPGRELCGNLYPFPAHVQPGRY